jgi:predicted  nucleic acid-binding Zn-ribbon protein
MLKEQVYTEITEVHARLKKTDSSIPDAIPDFLKNYTGNDKPLLVLKIRLDKINEQNTETVNLIVSKNLKIKDDTSTLTAAVDTSRNTKQQIEQATQKLEKANQKLKKLKQNLDEETTKQEAKKELTPISTVKSTPLLASMLSLNKERIDNILILGLDSTWKTKYTDLLKNIEQDVKYYD